MDAETSLPLNYAGPHIELAQPPELFARERRALSNMGRQMLFLTVLTALLAFATTRMETPSSSGTSRVQIEAFLDNVIFTIAVGYWSLRAIWPRRWVRPLGLVFAAYALVVGVSVLAIEISFFRDVYYGMVEASIFYALSIAIFIGIPLRVLWVCKPQFVKQMLEHYDPETRWTDACPIPVLGIVVACAFVAIMSPFPIISIIQKGPHSWSAAGWAGLDLLTGLAACYLMVKVYRLTLIGWWGALVGAVAMGVTSWNSPIMWTVSLSAVAYVIYVRRFFARAANGSPPP